MPVKNGEKYLNQIKHSLFQNCGKGDEILIINDNSNDKTSEIIRFWQSEGNKNLRVIENHSGNGLVSSLNLGVRESSNQWIARYDVDDSYSSDRINIAREYLTDNTVAIFSDYDFISENNRYLGRIPSAIFSDHTYLSLVSSQRTAHPSVIYRKDAVLEVGGYSSNFFPAEDIALWLELSKIGDLSSIPRSLLQYKIQRQSVSSTKRQLALSLKNKAVQSHNFRLNTILFLLDNLEQTKVDYNKFTHPQERYILHLRDLYILIKFNKVESSKSMYKFVLKKLLFEVDNYISFIQIAGRAFQRKVYRSLIS